MLRDSLRDTDTAAAAAAAAVTPEAVEGDLREAPNCENSLSCRTGDWCGSLRALKDRAGSNRSPTGVQRDGKEGQVYNAIEREKTTGCSSTVADSKKSDEELAEMLDQQEQAEVEAEKKRKHEEFLMSEELAKQLQEDDLALAASASASKRQKKQVSSCRFMHLVTSHYERH